MINLFKKNIYSFLSFATITDTSTTTTITTTSDYKPKLHYPRQQVLGLGLINATRVSNRPMNVLESTTLKPNNNPSPSNKNPPPSNKRIRFIDDGLMSCTESVGSESSSDERCPNDHQQRQQQLSLFPLDGSNVKNDNDNDDNNKKDAKSDDDCDDDDDCDLWRRRTMMRAEGRGYLRKVRSFPPPLSSLSRNGKPSFVLRPIRKDGRLELTEVRIQRPEILHASRHDGRLTLHLIPDHSIEEEEEEDIDALLEEQNMLEEEEELDTTLDEEEMMTHDDDEEEEEVECDSNTMVDEKEKEERVCMGGNESLRCYEMVNQHHHHHHMRMSGINICVPC